MWFLPLAMLAVVSGQYGAWLLVFATVAVMAVMRRCFVMLLLTLLVSAYSVVVLQGALAKRLPLHLAGEEVEIHGVISGLPEREWLGDRIALERVRFVIDGEVIDSRWPGRHRLALWWYSDDTSAVQAGAVLQLRVRLRSLHGRVNEAGMDSERLLLARGIAARGNVLSVHVVDDGGGLHRWRDQLSRRVQGVVAGEPSAAALLPALIAGDRRQLDESHWELLRYTGTAHLVAISGLHISLVAGLVWWLSRWCLAALLCRSSGHISAQRAAIVPAIIVAAGYAALAGFALPTQRALMMTVIAMVALLAGSRLSAGLLLWLVLMAVVLWSPLALLDNSFWLSFGAVSALMLMTMTGVRSLWRVQLVLTLAFGAVTALLFSDWSLAALPANLLLVPVFSLVLVPLSLLGALIPDAELLLVAAATLCQWCWRWLQGVSLLPVLPLPPGYWVALLLVVLVMRWAAPALPGPRWWLLWCLLPWLWADTGRPALGDVEVLAFDVGQGQLVALRTRDHLILYDLGPGWQGGEAASQVLIPWLRHRRLSPDLTFVSHSHLDHAGGLAAFSEGAFPGELYAGEPYAIAGSRACLRGQHWRLDNVDIEVLWPVEGLPLRHSNNRSCVVRVAANNQTVLLTGDIGIDVEHWLVEHSDLRADVLQVPHHGSATSSSYALLRAVSPSWAFVSAGYGNRFGHPVPLVTQRYQEMQIPLQVTGFGGMLIYGRAGEKSPISLRDARPFPWRLPTPVVE